MKNYNEIHNILMETIRNLKNLDIKDEYARDEIMRGNSIQSTAKAEKTWTLFVYRDISIVLNISSISVKPKRICFDIRIRRDEYTTYTSIYYHIDNSNYNVLKRQINGAIETLLNALEQNDIKREDGYWEIKNASCNEEDILKRIAEEFLDDNGVSNEEIRDCYINNYIYKNKRTNVYLSNYLDGRKYRCLPDLWIVYYKATENNEMYQLLLNKLSNERNFDELLKNIKESISIFKDDMEETDDYQDYVYTMQKELESI